MASPFTELVCGELLFSMLGSVTPKLRAVSFSCRADSEIRLRFILTSISESELELVDDIVTEFEAYHGYPVDLDYDVLESDEPMELLDHLDNIVYARYEASPEEYG